MFQFQHVPVVVTYDLCFPYSIYSRMILYVYIYNPNMSELSRLVNHSKLCNVYVCAYIYMYVLYLYTYIIYIYVYIYIIQCISHLGTGTHNDAHPSMDCA